MCAECVEASGLRSDCDLFSPPNCGTDDVLLLIASGGSIERMGFFLSVGCSVRAELV
jgi:hypothetical protein